MEQFYKLILWRKAEKEDVPFEEIAKRAYETITLFKVLEPKYQPNYEKVFSKKDAKLFDWDYNNFYNYLKSNVNREGKIEFKELGYSIGFFSSLNSNESCGYDLRVGATENPFTNTFLVRFSINMDIFNEEMSRKIELIFKQAVKIFEPFWGCVVNSRLNATDGYLNNDNSFPKAFHWLNYLSDEMLERLNKKALNALEKKYKIERDGNIIKLKNIALNANLAEDVKLKKDVDDVLVR